MSVKRAHSKLQESLFRRPSSTLFTPMSVKGSHYKFQEKSSSIIFILTSVKRSHSKLQESLYKKPSSLLFSVKRPHSKLQVSFHKKKSLSLSNPRSVRRQHMGLKTS